MTALHLELSALMTRCSTSRPSGSECMTSAHLTVATCNCIVQRQEKGRRCKVNRCSALQTVTLTAPAAIHGRGEGYAAPNAEERLSPREVDAEEPAHNRVWHESSSDGEGAELDI
ncbi:hypothetical protein MVEN_00865200 [Mycena venus]|uniref:Uncharacterized protein n=1 Tax=Mycena venus TaxID=2733690 RepID=A0A8H7D480_9AGAR|nr:hypothetical protein MVEN_00865200 [Mycena venus]